MHKKILRCCNYRFDLSKKPLVMGILNVTPDSFSDGGKYPSLSDAYKRAARMQDEGVDIIDIGGESTRPGSSGVSVKEETKRILPVLKKLKSRLNIALSVDTQKSEVAKIALEEGASIINDISGLKNDATIALLCTKYSAGLVIMHMKGSPRTMQQRPYYKDLIREVEQYFKKSVVLALKSGLNKNNIILDPGIGFGKTLQHNLRLLKDIDRFKKIGYPVLIGLSRKSFMGKLLDLDVDKRLAPTIAANAISIYNGADIIRVHDVKEAIIASKLAKAISSS